MKKIPMPVPLVEMDGDEMTRVIWAQVKELLLEPFIDLNTEYYDLGLPHRDETGDAVTLAAAEAIRKYHVGVKCATITPNRQRVEEYHLHQMWKSPNATIRAALDGTVFRTPILTDVIRPAVKTWRKPITIARHAYGDIYKATEFTVPGPGRAELVFTGADGAVRREPIYDFAGPGILQGLHNREDSITSFARAAFAYALSLGQDLWFSSKDTISKQYDGTFRAIFQRVYEEEYRAAFEKAGLTYFYTLIDDAVARVIRSEGGFVWALKNYDGDVMSDMVSTAFGSLAMMTSVLVSPEGNFEYEAAHGTVTRHWYRYQAGEETSTNPVATLFAWTGALQKRAELDNNAPLAAFARRVEEATLATIESGCMTKDLASLAEGIQPTILNTRPFLEKIAERL
ncbi:MAG: NADP-dependent isocitrate dehydrogenase [bacterium]